MATTSLGDITSYKRLYMQFRDSEGKTVNLTLDNPKNLDDDDYDDLGIRVMLSRRYGYHYREEYLS